MVKSSKALSLLELIIAITLLSVVLMTASSLLISFKKFYFDFVQRQSEIGEVSLGAFEEIVGRVKIANRVSVVTVDSFPGEPWKIETTVTIMTDTENTPDDYTDDTTHIYFWMGDKSESTDPKEGYPNIAYIQYRSFNPDTGPTILAYHIPSFSGQMEADNKVKVRIGVKPQGGVTQYFESTVVMRACAAEKL